MKKQILFLFALILFSTPFTTSALYAASPDSNVCAEDYKVLNFKTQIQMGEFSKGQCFISIDPFNSLNLVYRSYLMVTDASLMIFNSFGDGPNATSTGAREILFFPRKLSLNYRLDPKSVNIEMSGQNFVIDIETSRFLQIDGVVFKEAQDVRKDNEGGISIASSERLYLDLGFKLGSAPRSEQGRKVYFHDAHQITCEVLNSEVYDYKTDPQSPIFKFTTDQELAQYLRFRCPQLDLTISNLK